MQRHETSGRDAVRLRKHDQRGRELIHVVDALHTIAFEQRLVRGINTCDCARVGNSEAGRQLGPAAALCVDDMRLTRK